MNPKLRTFGKRVLSKIIPDSNKLMYLSYLPRLETFRKKHKEEYPFFRKRNMLYEYLNNIIFNNCSLDYLEFGVYWGASIMYWVELNTNIDSRFNGFDTFTGLPEKWENFTDGMNINFHDVNGKIPQINDSRVLFTKGLFQETLPTFLDSFKPKGKLIINNDSDLYSSSLFVLTCMHKFIIPGTVIIFDELSSVVHELRALEDYCSAYRRTFKVLAAVVSDINYFSTVAIEIE